MENMLELRFAFSIESSHSVQVDAVPSSGKPFSVPSTVTSGLDVRRILSPSPG